MNKTVNTEIYKKKILINVGYTRKMINIKFNMVGLYGKKCTLNCYVHTILDKKEM